MATCTHWVESEGGWGPGPALGSSPHGDTVTGGHWRCAGCQEEVSGGHEAEAEML